MRKVIDKSYVEDFQNGNKEAFEYIYSYYKESVYFFVMTMTKNVADAEEIVQDTFIKVTKNIKSLKSPNAFHSWLFRIAFTTTKDKYQRKNFISVLESDTNLEDLLESDVDISKECEGGELVDIIKGEIEKMSDRFTTIAYLKYFDDLTTKEIAEILDLPEGTVKTRLKKIRQQLQPILAKNGYTPNTFLSISISPFMVKAFSQLMEENPLTSESSMKIFENILSGTSMIVGGGQAVASGATTLAKIALTSSIIASSIGIYAVHGMIEQESQFHIEYIAYHQGLTNKSIEVEIGLNKEITNDEIVIDVNGKKVAFYVQDQKIIFIAENNGTYKATVKDEAETIKINNIDREEPSLMGATYKNQLLLLDIKDNSAIDYQKSYIVVNGEQHTIPESHELEVLLDGEFEVHLVDTVGNQSAYSLEVEEG